MKDVIYVMRLIVCGWLALLMLPLFLVLWVAVWCVNVIAPPQIEIGVDIRLYARKEETL